MFIFCIQICEEKSHNRGLPVLVSRGGSKALFPHLLKSVKKLTTFISKLKLRTSLTDFNAPYWIYQEIKKKVENGFKPQPRLRFCPKVLCFLKRITINRGVKNCQLWQLDTKTKANTLGLSNNSSHALFPLRTQHSISSFLENQTFNRSINIVYRS